jgi:hypothetical protein
MYKRKPLQQLKERVTGGAGWPAGSELRWARGAFRRKQPFRRNGTHAPSLQLVYSLKWIVSILIVHRERRNTLLYIQIKENTISKEKDMSLK